MVCDASPLDTLSQCRRSDRRYSWLCIERASPECSSGLADGCGDTSPFKTTDTCRRVHSKRLT